MSQWQDLSSPTAHLQLQILQVVKPESQSSSWLAIQCVPTQQLFLCASKCMSNNVSLHSLPIVALQLNHTSSGIQLLGPAQPSSTAATVVLQAVQCFPILVWLLGLDFQSQLQRTRTHCT